MKEPTDWEYHEKKIMQQVSFEFEWKTLIMKIWGYLKRLAGK